jgi:hypothetical protein
MLVWDFSSVESAEAEAEGGEGSALTMEPEGS